MNYSSDILHDARKVFEYLYVRQDPEKADVILGFGHFDLKIPRRCAELYLQGYASKILFMGGVGAGSADFEFPEAVEFKNLLQREYPQIPENDIIIEPGSTNTGENLRFMQEVLYQRDPGFTFQSGIRKALKVSNAYRQRRAYLTCKKLFPGVVFINTPAETTFEEELELYRSKHQDLLRHLTGEMERMIRYPAMDFIVAADIPKEIIRAYDIIREVAPKYQKNVEC